MGMFSLGEKRVSTLIKRPRSGLYISLEGVEGVGKTFYQNYLVSRSSEFKNSIRTVTPVIEVSKNGFGKEITDVLARHDDEFFRCGFPISEALVFFSMKLFELINTVVPAMKNNEIVLEDRSIDTNCIYAAIQIEEKYNIKLEESLKHLYNVREELSFSPDITILLLDEFSSCIERADTRIGRKLTNEEQIFVRRVQSVFERIPELFPKRIIPIRLNKISLKDRKNVVWDLFKDICKEKGFIEK